MFSKKKRWMSKGYESWVRSQPCMLCDTPNAELHHIKGIGNFSGVGMKCSSILTMPACKGCHRLLHEHPELYGHQQTIWILQIINRALEDGVLIESSKI